MSDTDIVAEVMSDMRSRNADRAPHGCGGVCIGKTQG
ncbi:Hypothetical protein AAM4_2691 [Actinomyces succiniciruminis]|uniref:Uncharacterized protein n=1 Tax=Actinomyces succiniciruminis TaxID=1522002 RepID=A0A1L7RTF6_9ACTO|nr:Hypothetical protein AAM4_2691 [Actinomyces succiniciruminis]